MTPPLGRLIGEGKTRRVYVHADDPTCVVKVARGPQWASANMAEWAAWRRIQECGHVRWVSPCRDVAPDGMWLTMDRTKPLSGKARIPDGAPAWFGADVKPSNWGRLNGRAVLHDYSDAEPPCE